MNRILSSTRTANERFRTVKELFRMLRANGRWWVMPFFVIVVFLSIVLTVLQAIPYVAPFIYTIF
ncbi:MAG: hypothetical protein JSR90_06870 [Proteobacteria bacterium]|nr:hypothetical protein [Pseudomonadota bacterium]